jgi:predicted XRE-type DNA-binding protein
MRKMKITPIVVSHRAVDIGTDIRKLDSVVFIDKPDEQTAEFYHEEDNGDLADKVLTLNNYSTEERFEYDTDDLFISWDWDGLDEIVDLMENPQEFKDLWETKGVIKDLRETAEEIQRIEELEDDRKELIEQAAELDYSQSEIAEFAGLDPSRVSRVLADA